MPLALGAKPKQSVQNKLQAILARSPVPSALAASFFQLSRRFLSGKTAANPLEEAVFGVMQSLPPDLSRILSCSLDNFDSIPDAERERLYLSTLTDDVNTPINPATLGEAVGQEIAQRTSQVIFGDPQAAEQERAGRNRFFDPTGGETFDVQLRICRVNGIRTLEFLPPIGPGDFLPEELEQKCNPIVVGDHVEFDAHALEPAGEVRVGRQVAQAGARGGVYEGELAVRAHGPAPGVPGRGRDRHGALRHAARLPDDAHGP